jgi:hypothetical protein
MLPVMWRADPTPGGTTAVPARPAPAVIDAQSAVVKAFVDAPPDPVEDAVVVPPPPAAIPEAPPPTQAPYSPAPSPPVAQPVEEPAATGFWSEPAEPALKRFLHNVPVFAVVQVLFVIVALIIVLIWIG